MAKQASLPVLVWLCIGLQLTGSPTADAVAATLSDYVQPIYVVTEKFLDFIQPHDKSILLSNVLPALLNGSARLTAATGNSSQSFDWQATITRYWENMMGYFILICIGLALIIVVPLAGLITCSCRCCCHRCGGKGRRMEKRGSACRRGVYGTLVLLLVTAMALGVVLAFISNQLVRQQMDYTQGDTLLATVSGSMSDIADLLTEIPLRAKANSGSAVATLVAAVVPATNVSMMRLRSNLGASSKADTGLSTAVTAMQQLGMATSYSGSYISFHANYSSSLDSLNTMLTVLKANLTGVDSDCPFNAIQSDCDLIARQLPGLKVTQNSNNTGLQNITDLNTLLRAIDSARLIRNLTDVQTALDNVSNVALAYVMNYTSDLRNTLNSSRELETIWTQVEKLFNTLGGFISNSTYSVNSSVLDPVTRTSKQLEVVAANLDLIRYAVYLIIACLALLVILLWLVGVSYGLCGEPPYEDARCCNRGAGANLLIAGTAISFICYSLLFAVILALFLAGGLTDTEVCRYLTGRAGSSGYKQLDKSINQLLQATTPELSKYSLNLASGLLDGCSSGNASITAALNIQALVQASDIDSLVNQFINRTNSFLQSHRSDLVSGVALNLNLSSMEIVATTASAQPQMPFIGELQKQMIQGSDQVFSAIQNISLTASKPQDKARFVALVAYLNGAVKMAETLVQSQVVSLSGLGASLLQLNATAAGITGTLQASHILIQTPLTIELAINEAMSNLTAQLQVIVRDTVTQVIAAAADCVTVNQKLTDLVRAPCVTFLRPFNGFWTGMGVFLICLLPCLLLTVKLANLYRKTHTHQADYVDGTLTLMNHYNRKLSGSTELNMSFV